GSVTGVQTCALPISQKKPIRRCVSISNPGPTCARYSGRPVERAQSCTERSEGAGEPPLQSAPAAGQEVMMSAKNLPEIGVGAVGHSFMGAVHSHAWRTVSHVGTPVARTTMRVLAGRNKNRAQAAAEKLGWDEATDDWRTLLDRPDIQVIDILTPGDTHEEIAVAALEAGKHVICEKPLAASAAAAERMAVAAQNARARGVASMVGFNYRHVPALGLARQLVATGRLGTVRQVRAVYLQDFIVDETFPL